MIRRHDGDPLAASLAAEALSYGIDPRQEGVGIVFPSDGIAPEVDPVDEDGGGNHPDAGSGEGPDEHDGKDKAGDAGKRDDTGKPGHPGGGNDSAGAEHADGQDVDPGIRSAAGSPAPRHAADSPAAGAIPGIPGENAGFSEYGEETDTPGASLVARLIQGATLAFASSSRRPDDSKGGWTSFPLSISVSGVDFYGVIRLWYSGVSLTAGRLVLDIRDGRSRRVVDVRGKNSPSIAYHSDDESERSAFEKCFGHDPKYSSDSLEAFDLDECFGLGAVDGNA